MLVALLCGFRAGVLATVLAGLSAAIWVLPPIGRPQIASAADVISLAVFVLTGVFMSGVAGLYHRARARAAEYEIQLARRESEEKFRLLVSGVEDYAIFFVDPDGSVSSWNEGAQRIKGYTAEEVIGKPFSIFYTPEDIRGGKPEATLALARKEGRHEEEVLRVRKDGSTFWADEYTTPLCDDDGKLRGYAKIIRDITERRQAQDALAEQNRLLDLAHVLIRNPHDRIVTWNTGLEALYGYSKEDAVGRVSHDLLKDGVS